MKKNIYSFFLSFLIFSTVSIVPAKERMDWKMIQKAFAIYIEYPSDKNAAKVSSLLPTDGHIKYTGGQEENIVIEFIYNNLGMLERQVISRDPEAVRLALKLMTIADGAFAEDLDIILGQLIRIDPKLFLAEIKEANIKRLDGLVGNYGDMYVDKIEAQRLETEKRIQALQSVSNPELKKIRNKCIDALKQNELE